MPTTSPYRSLPADRRVALITQAMKLHRELRTLYAQRLVARGGGFRAVTVNSWPPAQLAREVVRLNPQSADDEVELLQALYLEVQPEIQASFLDAAGVAHAAGVIAESAEPPYASEAAVATGAAAVRAQHGDDGLHYLRTIARYNGAAWPGIDALV